MIRRKISAGVLRASKSNSSLRATAVAQSHAVPSSTQTQTAGLASATLLSSQRAWSKETVVTLKTELKKRGLSQVGNKSTLIERLSDAESSALLPPVPPMPSKITSTTIFNRQLSTTASVALPPKKSSSPKPPPAPVNSDQVTSAGPSVISQRTEAPKTAAVAPELITVAPGLPQSKDTGPAKKESLHVQMPTPSAEEEIDQIIPVTPDNFRSAPSKPTTSTSEPSTPKVVTVASAATHHGGGPSHAIHEATDSHTIDAAVEEIKTNLPSLNSAVSTALAAPGQAWKSADLGKSLLPEIGLPEGNGGGEYKAPKKELDNEERRGLWVMGGIVGLGLLFGGGRSRREKREKKHAKVAAAAAAIGVKGDAEWEKASGAGVVGHGTRKDTA